MYVWGEINYSLCFLGRSSDKILAESWVFSIWLNRKILIFWVSASRFWTNNVLMSKPAVPDSLPQKKIAQTSYLWVPFQLNGCKSSVYPNWVPLKPQLADWSMLLGFTQATCRVRRLHSRYAPSSTGFEAFLFSGTLNFSAIKQRPQKIQTSGRKKKLCWERGKKNITVL